ncbi:MAG TPA: hypothetical protein VFE33_08695 [Thermoanaerobaculia bacterium]|nr:hypothetical protein [Thermoanaerobaculia bacterium]
MRSTILFLALLLGGAAAEAGDLAAPPFVAIPPVQVAGYHLDFARHFFASPEQEVAARRELEDRLKRLEALRGQVTQTPGALQEALRLDEQVPGRGPAPRRLSPSAPRGGYPGREERTG